MEPKKGARPEDGTGRLGRGEKDLSIFREAGLREEVRGVDGMEVKVIHRSGS